MNGAHPAGSPGQETHAGNENAIKQINLITLPRKHQKHMSILHFPPHISELNSTILKKKQCATNEFNHFAMEMFDKPMNLTTLVWKCWKNQLI